MGYRIVADENVEPATRNHLRKLGHDVEWIGYLSELGFGATDREIAAYAREHDRLILTQDDDFFTTIDPEETAGILFQADQSLSAQDVGTIIHELSQHLDQKEITLEYVSRNWL